MKYAMTKNLPHYMNSIFVEAWDNFKVSTLNISREIFVKTKLLPLSSPNITTKTQACADSIQVSSGENSEEINGISRLTIVPIEVQ